MIDSFKQFSVYELSLLAELPRYDSLRHLARAKGLSVTKLSRLVKVFEERLGFSVIHRSAMGISLTPEGQKVFKQVQNAVASIDSIELARASPHPERIEKYFSFGGRGFLNVALASVIHDAVHGVDPSIGLRFIDLSPEETVECAMSSSLDFALSLEPIDLGKNWFAIPVGSLVWRVYAGQNHPLFQRSSSQDLKSYRVIHQSYWNGEMIVTGPPVIKNRDLLKVGHGAQTALTALALVLESGELAALPSVIADPYLKRHELVEIELDENMRTQVFLQVRQDVPINCFNSVRRAIEDKLSRTQ